MGGSSGAESSGMDCCSKMGTSTCPGDNTSADEASACPSGADPSDSPISSANLRCL